MTARSTSTFRFAILAFVILIAITPCVFAEPALRLGRFELDATPKMGAPLAYNRRTKEGGRLSCRGVVLLPSDQKPIVLAAIDWIGVGNDGYIAFREALAKAVGTMPQRVAFHALHQHDAPRCDFTAEAILAEQGLPGEMFDVAFAREVIRRCAEAAGKAAEDAKPVTHIALGQAEVEKVASNRRILGPDGKVQFTRWTATRDPKVRAMPTGVIDPYVKLIAFWHGDQPLVALTYYATHPQSYYRTGAASTDFPGLARQQRDDALPGVLHVHFNGAGGNIGAGKWNDGAPANRQVLADRVAAGMAGAWENSLKHKRELKPDDIGWQSVPVKLPPSKHLDAEKLKANVASEKVHRSTRIRSAVHLAWLNRCAAGDTIDVSCLRLQSARVLHLPGELFVEYQLAAQKLKPQHFVAMAAYGDYAPGYIGTEIAYSQGGYETSPMGSRVAPEVEKQLMDAITELLER